jgi:hypothetical protein
VKNLPTETLAEMNQRLDELRLLLTDALPYGHYVAVSATWAEDRDGGGLVTFTASTAYAEDDEARDHA